MTLYEIHVADHQGLEWLKAHYPPPPVQYDPLLARMGSVGGVPVTIDLGVPPGFVEFLQRYPDGSFTRTCVRMSAIDGEPVPM